MKYYVCAEINLSGNCIRWFELTPDIIKTYAETDQNTFLSELAKLSFTDAQTLLAFTAALFASAWVWRLLSKQAFR